MDNNLNICVLSFATGNIWSWAASVFKNNKEYCEKHGYKWSGHYGLKDPNRPTNWSKIAYILDEMKNGYDWIFWIDADAMIMNHKIKVEDLIDNDYDFAVSHSPCGWCTGTWFINNNNYSKELLEYTYSKEDFINHSSGIQVDAAFANAVYEKGARIIVHDQKKMNSLPPFRFFNKRNEFRDFTVEAGVFKHSATRKSFEENSFEKGDFVLHAAGLNNLGRETVFRKHKEYIIK
tara:strand:+ start:7131 stop:7832 length:702 start_codon:yes stop_codon:yes gene_type:complete